MKPVVLGVALAALAACGAAPNDGLEVRRSTLRDTSWRDPSVNRSDSVTPAAREPDRARGTDKADKTGMGR